MSLSVKDRIPFKNALKSAVSYLVRAWARARHFHFPAKYPWDWRVEMLRERYEKDTTDLFRNLVRPGMTVLDIGAHIGYFSRLFAERVGPRGKVFAFEPDPANFALLKKNTERFVNITIVPSAVSDTTGTIDFYEIEDSTGCHTTVETSAPSKKLRVQALRIDDFTGERNLTVDVIKMDIEGGEPRAIAGMQRVLSQKAPLSVVMEFNPTALASAGTSSQEVISSFEKLGFKGYGILPGGVRGPLKSDLSNLAMYQGKSEYANVLFEK